MKRKITTDTAKDQTMAAAKKLRAKRRKAKLAEIIKGKLQKVAVLVGGLRQQLRMQEQELVSLREHTNVGNEARSGEAGPVADTVHGNDSAAGT